MVASPQSASTELLRPGIPVRVRTSGLPGKVFEGAVTRTSEAINPQARTLKVEVDLPNHDRLLIPGMYVEVAFSVGETNRPQVPPAALVLGVFLTMQPLGWLLLLLSGVIATTRVKN